MTDQQLQKDRYVLCEAVVYESVDDEFGVACTDKAVWEVPLSDGRVHPRCAAHVPAPRMFFARRLDMT